MNLTQQQAKAYRHYQTGELTQKQIAEDVGVSDRTIRTWIRMFNWQRLKGAAMAAPSMIAEKMSGQVVELLDAINARKKGQRYPSSKEADVLRKLCICIDKFNRYPTLGQTMQSVRSFVDFIDQKDEFLALQVHKEYNEFLNQQCRNGYRPFEMGYDVEPMAVVAPRFPEETCPAYLEDDDPYTPPYDTLDRRRLPLQPFPHAVSEAENIAEVLENEHTSLPRHAEESGSTQMKTEGAFTSTTIPEITVEDTPLPANAPLTWQDFEAHKHLLQQPVASLFYTMDFNDRLVSRSWLQYNLFQLYLPADKRCFIANDREYVSRCNPQAVYDDILLFFKNRSGKS